MVSSVRMAGRERMGGVDAAWLHMDRPANVMNVTALLWFDDPVDWNRWEEIVEARLVGRFPRLRQRVVEAGLPRIGPAWEDDPHFDPSAHLHRRVLPARDNRREMEKLVGRLMGASLPRQKPLWDLHLVDRYRGGCAVIARFHHCIADGIALARVLLAISDDDGRAGLLSEATGDGPRSNGGLIRRGGWLASQAGHTAWAAVMGASRIARAPVKLSQLPGQGRRNAGALGKALFTGSDRPTALKGELSGSLEVAWSTPLPLARVIAIGRRAGATVNDVILAALTGALRRYLIRHESVVDQIRASVPLNLRPLDQPLPPKLGNHFGLVFVPLPVGQQTASARLAAIKRTMASIKHSSEAALSLRLLGAMGVTPAAIEQRLLGLLSGRVSAVITNLPGPRQPLHIGGTPLAGILFWAPRGGTISTTISVFTYAERLTVGVGADTAVVGDPGSIVAELEPELDALAAGAAGPRRSRASA